MKGKFILIILVIVLCLTSFACKGKRGDEGKPHASSVDGLDFVIDFPEGEEITILQLADTQAMLYEGIRGERWHNVHNAFFQSGVYDTYTRVWQYVEEGVRRTNPDLLVLTGDNIYGETDDTGLLWKEMIDVMDSFEIPWLCIFGNHDNESEKGVLWQLEMVEKSNYGIIKRGSCTSGNSNYTVGICQGGKITRVFYMLDTNGCCVKTGGEAMLETNRDIEHITQSTGLFGDQYAWMDECGQKLYSQGITAPAFIFMHIPSQDVNMAAINKYPLSHNIYPFYPTEPGDVGVAKEGYGGFGTGGIFMGTAKAVGADGVFVGHQHKIATSIVYNGIRMTYGLKTGTGDYHDRDMLGTTKITLHPGVDEFSVEYVHTQIPYPL